MAVDSKGVELKKGDKVIFTLSSIEFGNPEGLHTVVGFYDCLVVLALMKGTGMDDRRGLTLNCGLSEKDIKGNVWRVSSGDLIIVG